MNADPRSRPIAFLLAIAGLASASACVSETGLGPADETPSIAGDAIAGLRAFEDECASCHASEDALDLAFFAFPDTTIVRRAVAHVDTATAHDIVAGVRTLRTARHARDFRAFQPGGRRAPGDANFATQLFDADRWPTDLTAGELASIDPRDVPVALEFPLWSFESSNLDWMPDRPIDEGILDYATEIGVPRALLDRYRETGAETDLINATLALRLAERDPANPDAPCVMDPLDRFEPADCFQSRRWIATLAAQHMFRNHETRPVHPILHDAWWDVGNAARRSRQTAEPIPNAIENWAQWMYLGWTFEPDRHASVYLSTALTALGLPRHATFHAARAMVARGPNGPAPFIDVRTTARFAPPHWAFDAVRFGLEHLLDRLDAGVRMRRRDQIDQARLAVVDAVVLASRKIADPAESDELARLRDEVLAGIDRLVPIEPG